MLYTEQGLSQGGCKALSAGPAVTLDHHSLQSQQESTAMLVGIQRAA